MSETFEGQLDLIEHAYNSHFHFWYGVAHIHCSHKHFLDLLGALAGRQTGRPPRDRVPLYS
jgi:hypothetical protein